MKESSKNRTEYQIFLHSLFVKYGISYIGESWLTPEWEVIVSRLSAEEQENFNKELSEFNIKNPSDENIWSDEELEEFKAEKVKAGKVKAEKLKSEKVKAEEFKLIVQEAQKLKSEKVKAEEFKLIVQEAQKLKAGKVKEEEFKKYQELLNALLIKYGIKPDEDWTNDIVWTTLIDSKLDTKQRNLFYNEFTKLELKYKGMTYNSAKVSTHKIDEKLEKDGDEVKAEEVKLEEEPITDAKKVEEFKECPYCAEDIKYEAIKCKHCGELLGEAAEDEEYGWEDWGNIFWSVFGFGTLIVIYIQWKYPYKFYEIYFQNWF